MQTFKCSYCGTDVPFDPAASVTVCPGCGVTLPPPEREGAGTAPVQEVPAAEAPAASAAGGVSDALAQGKRLLSEGSSDSARECFERVLAEDGANAEASFGLFLAGYQLKDESDMLSHAQVRPLSGNPKLMWARQPDESFIRSTVRPLVVENYLSEQQLRGLFDFELRYPSFEDEAKRNLASMRQAVSDNPRFSEAKKNADPAFLARLNDIEQQMLRPALEQVQKAAGDAEQAKQKVLSDYQQYLHRQADTARQMNASAMQARNADYAAACSQMNLGLSPANAGTVIALLQKVGTYQDAEYRLEMCRRTVAEANARMQPYGSPAPYGGPAPSGYAAPMTREVPAAAPAPAASARSAKRSSSLQKIGIIAAIIALLVVGGYFLTSGVILPSIKYNRADALCRNGEYKDAIKLLKEMGTDKADKKLEDVYDTLQDKVDAEIHDGNYAEAKEYYSLLPGKLQDTEYDKFLEIALTDFDDGELHDVAKLYEAANRLNNEDLKKQLMTIPQFKTVQTLEGYWVKYDNSLVDFTFHNGRDQEYSTVYLQYMNGHYYSYYKDENDYIELKNITSSSLDELCIDEGSVYWDWHYVHR